MILGRLCPGLRLKPWRGAVAIALLAGWLVTPAGATIVPAFGTLAIPGFNGDLVISDATDGDPATTRDALRPLIVYNFQKTDPLPPVEAVTFRFKFSVIRQSDGASIFLQNPAGGGTNEIIETRSFGLSSPSLMILSLPVQAELKVAQRLEPSQRYAIECIVERDAGGGTWTAVGTHRTAPQQVWHFFGTDPAGAALNTIAEITTFSLERNNLVRSQPGQQAFKLTINGTARRYDEWTSPSPGSATAQLPVNWTLRNVSTNTQLTLATPVKNVPVTLPSFVSGTIRTPSTSTFTSVLDVQLADWTTLSAIPPYECRVRLMQPDFPAQESQNALGFQRYLCALSGRLFFGTYATDFTAVGNDVAQTAVNPVKAGYAAKAGLLIANVASVVPGTVHTFAVSPTQEIHLAANGDAYFTDNDGSVLLTAPTSPDRSAVAGVVFERQGTSATAMGIRARVKVWLPTGLGYGFAEGQRRMKGVIDLPGSTTLNIGLRPGDKFIQPSEVQAGASVFWLASERLPMRFQTSALIWNVAAGTWSWTPEGFNFERERELAALEVFSPNILAEPTSADRWGNDHHFRRAFITPDTTTIGARAEVGSGGAQVSGQTTLNALSLSHTAGEFTAHFPAGVTVAHTASILSLRWTLDRIASSSRLNHGGAASARTISWNRGCPSESCGDGASAVAARTTTFTPTGTQWNFTPDGGLRGSVSVANVPLEWGAITSALSEQFAHRTSAFADGRLLIAGSILRGINPDTGAPDPAIAPLATRNKVSALLLSGHASPADAARLERPGTTEYFQGLADYPGLNFRVVSNGAKTGTSRLGGVSTPTYNLLGTSKYYVRRAGVSGLHQAVAGADLPLVIYGLGMVLSQPRLSFLDGLNEASAMSGSVHVPAPSDLDFDFDHLTFTCQGGLDSAGLANPAEQTLAYWKTRITPYSLSFAAPKGCQPPSAGFLAVGVAAKLPSLTDTPLTGTLGFGADGDLLSAGDALTAGTGITSRLTPPPNLTFKAAGTKTWKFTPTTKVYLNDWSLRPADAGSLGWVNLAGLLDVPFFENMPVHVQASSTTGSSSAGDTAFFAGGWGNDGATNFNMANFDGLNQGVPPGTQVTVYRAGSLPHAVRSNWQGLIDFDFPVLYNTGTRTFRQQGDATTDLVIFEMTNRLKLLSPTSAEMSFGIEPGGSLDLSLTTLTDLLDVPDPASLLAKFDAEVGAGGSFSSVLQGLGKIDALLADTLTEILGPGLDGVASSVSAALYNDLRNVYENDPAGYANFSADYLLAASTRGVVQSPIPALLTNPNNAAVGWRQEALTRVQQVRTSLARLKQIAQNVGGPVGKLVKVVAGKPTAAALSPAATEAMADLVTTLTQLDGTLGSLETALAPAGTLTVELLAALNNGSGASLNAAVGSALGLIAPKWTDPVSAPGQFFIEHTQAEFTTDLQAALRGAFAASEISPLMLEAFKEQLFDTRSAIADGTDAFLQTITSEAVALTDVLPAGFDTVLSGKGILDSVFEGTQLRGHARINGDTLSELRIEGKLKMRPPVDLDVEGYLLYRGVDSSQPGGACRLAGGVASEVLIGAKTKTKLLGSDAKVAVDGKFGFNAGSLVSLAGSIGLEGEFDLETLKISEAKFLFGFGGNEAYIAARAAGKIGIARGEVAIFAGKTCDIGVLQQVDKDVGGLLTRSEVGLTNPSATEPIYGVFAYGQGAISLPVLLGIPPTCLLDIRVGQGFGPFVFYRPAVPETNTTYVVGMKSLASLSGEFLCIVDVTGEIAVFGAATAHPPLLSLSSYSFTGTGRGTLRGEIGISPFSVSFDQSVYLNFTTVPPPGGTWSFDW